MKTLISSLVIILMTSSCKKEVIVYREVAPVRSWSVDSFFIGPDRILLSSLALDDSIIVLATASHLSYLNANTPSATTGGGFINPRAAYGYLMAPSLSPELGATLIDATHLRIFSTLNPVGSFTTFTYTPTYTNAQYSIKAFPLPDFPDAGYPIIRSKFILAPTEIDYTEDKAHLTMLEVATSSIPEPNSVALTSTTELTVTPHPSTVGFGDGAYYSATFYDRFFLQFGGQFYRVDTAGNVKSFGYGPVDVPSNGQVRQMFTLGNNLFAITISRLLVSQDQGENWHQFAELQGLSPFLLANYVNVGEDLYAVVDHRIARVTLTGSSLSLQELDTDGLEGNQITSISRAGKYTVVTTLAGLYFRETSKFNTPK